jgi:rhomboid protease GluP
MPPDTQPAEAQPASPQPVSPQTVAETGFAPTRESAAQAQTRQAPRRREFSEWDPRSAPGTYALLSVNIAVFLWMILHGVSISTPTNAQLEYFGSDNAFLVLAGHQWYRLLTAIFVHIGIIHIATNMWCLWNLGLLGEPLVGPWGLVAVYVLTGVCGNLLSITISVAEAHLINQPLQYVAVDGAGASGAVFGIAGILIVLLSNRRLPIPWTELQRLRTSVVRFAAINLVIGAGTIALNTPIRIDNSAHIGGFLCGLALGPGLVPQMTAGRTRYLARQKVVFLAAAFALSLFGYWIANVK